VCLQFQQRVEAGLQAIGAKIALGRDI